jgi:hypothetical protein
LVFAKGHAHACPFALETAKPWDRMSLKARLAVQCLLTAVVTGAMLFLPAGTFRFWQGWIFLGLLLIPMVPAAIKGKSRRTEIDHEIREGHFLWRFFAAGI